MVLHVVNPDLPPTLPSLPSQTSLLADQSLQIVHTRPQRGSALPSGPMPRRSGAIKAHHIRRQSWTHPSSKPPHLHIDIPSSSKAGPKAAKFNESDHTKLPDPRRHSDPPTADPWTDDRDGLTDFWNYNDSEGFKEAFLDISPVAFVSVPPPLRVRSRNVPPTAIAPVRPIPYRPYQAPPQPQQQQQQQSPSATNISPLTPPAQKDLSDPFQTTPPPRPSSLARAPGVATRPSTALRTSSSSASSSSSIAPPQPRSPSRPHQPNNQRPPSLLRIKTPPVAQSALSTLFSPSGSPREISPPRQRPQEPLKIEAVSPLSPQLPLTGPLHTRATAQATTTSPPFKSTALPPLLAEYIIPPPRPLNAAGPELEPTQRRVEIDSSSAQIQRLDHLLQGWGEGTTPVTPAGVRVGGW